jgi:hypothetical protein
MDHKEYLESRGVQISSINGDEIQVFCPFHEDTNPSASFNTTKEAFNCLSGCGGMSLPKFEMRLTGKSWSDAITELDIMRGKIPTVPHQEIEERHNVLLSSKDIQLSLVEQKGITLEAVQKFNLGWDTKEKRLWVPNKFHDHYLGVYKYDVFGHTKASAKPQKVLQYKKGVSYKGLFPHSLTGNRFDRLLVVEGIADTITCNILGVPTVTAGSASSDLSKYLDIFNDKEIVICLDNDDAGRDAMTKQAEYLHTKGLNFKLMWLAEYGVPEGFDINDCIVKLGWTKENILSAMDLSKRYSDDKHVEPTVELGSVLPIKFGTYPRDQYGGTVVSFLCTLEGKVEEVKQIPKELNIVCSKAKGNKCVGCPAFAGTPLEVVPEINRSGYINFYFSGAVRDRENIGSYFGLGCETFSIDSDRMTLTTIQQLKLGPHENIDLSNEVNTALGFTDKLDLPFNRVYTVKATPIRHPKTNRVILLINDIQEAEEELFFLSDDTKKMLDDFKEEVTNEEST